MKVLGRRHHSRGGDSKGRLRPSFKNRKWRSLPAIMLSLSFLQYYFSVSSTPLAMGQKSTPAFVIPKTKSAGNYLKVSKTRIFFDHKNMEKHESSRNSTDIPMKTNLFPRKLSAQPTRSSESPTELSALSSSVDLCMASGGVKKRKNRENPSYKIYCDMDGCLVNFEKGVRMLLKTGSSDIDKRLMWEGISRSPLWFEQLEWQMDGKRLWNAIKHLNPDILTGVPDIKASRVEKFNWCKRELGLNEADAHHVDMAADGLNDHKSVNGNFPREDKTNIITCWSNNKYKECNKHGSILIDDRIDLKKSWEAAGGIFIHHINTEMTIRKLRDLGVISERQLENQEDGWYWEGSWKFWRND